jgi:ribonuclease J
MATCCTPGDWKLDPHPLIGPPTDEAAFARLGEEGVLAMVCDSTNAMVEGHSGSEGEVRRNLAALIKPMRGRVAVTCFATNLARVESIALAAKAPGGTWRCSGAACATPSPRRGVRLPVTGARLPHRGGGGHIPDDNLCSSAPAARARSAARWPRSRRHPPGDLAGRGDTVIFSSRMIPGNERGILRVQDELSRRGCRVMTADDHAVHVSGHPARDELKRLYALVKPKLSIPVHGEWRHLSEHAALAREAGARALIIEDGDIVRLAPGEPVVADSAVVGRLAVDGNRLLPISGGVLGARKRMLFNGIVVASLAVDGQGKVVGRPRVSAPGLFDVAGPEQEQLADELARAMGELPRGLKREDEAMSEAARALLRKAVGRRLKKRPNVEVHLLRV